MNRQKSHTLPICLFEESLTLQQSQRQNAGPMPSLF